jgi:hypothetical protein
MPKTFLGMGGYGCILHPAVVFRNSTFVTEENKNLYVTKISRDAESEYNFCEIAMGILGEDAQTVGIFPVENLHCGVSARDLGEIAETVYAKCSPIRNRTIAGRNKIFQYNREVPLYISPISEVSPIDIDVLQGGRSCGPRGGTIDKNTYLCAIQYPAYDSDLRKFAKKTMRKERMGNFERMNIFEMVQDTLLENLKILHSKGIMHLDIKMDNVGVTADGEAKFADWDFACFELSEDSVNDCYDRSLTDGFAAYYEEITFDEFAVPETIELYQATRLRQDPDKRTKLNLLKIIDMACVYSTLLEMWTEFGLESQVYKAKKEDYIERFNAWLDE